MSRATNDKLTNLQDYFGKYIENSESAGNTIAQNTTDLDQCSQMVNNIVSATQQQTNVADNLAQLSENLTSNTEFISNVLSKEADNLCNIVNPFLKPSTSESIISTLATRLTDHAVFLQSTMTEAGKGLKVPTYKECVF